jgi:hypothetical protein
MSNPHVYDNEAYTQAGLDLQEAIEALYNAGATAEELAAEIEAAVDVTPAEFAADVKRRL